MELRRYIESFTQYQDPKPSLPERIEEGRKQLFDFDYPFFDDDYKSVFETNFIRSFYFREIGFDVMDRFKFELENYMRLNMSYWNKLFESELIEYDVLTNYKLTEEYKRNVDKNQDVDNKRSTDSKLDVKANAVGSANATGKTTTDTTDHSTGSSNSTNDTNNKSVVGNKSNSKTTNDEVYSDTPQGMLSNKDYATNATFTKNTNDKSNDTTTTDTGKANGSNTQKSDSTGNQISDTTQQSSTKDDQTTNQLEVGKDNLIGKTKTLTVEDYILTKVGKVGERNYPKMIEEYRSTLLRIEKQIFKEMNKQLFMLIYNY